jgi:citrate synthase
MTQQVAHGSVELRVDDTALELPRVPATLGNDGVGVAALLKETGVVTYDPGFMNTASAESAITYIDGD